MRLSSGSRAFTKWGALKITSCGFRMTIRCLRASSYCASESVVKRPLPALSRLRIQSRRWMSSVSTHFASSLAQVRTTRRESRLPFFFLPNDSRTTFL